MKKKKGLRKEIILRACMWKKIASAELSDIRIIYEFNKRVPATEKKARYPPASVRRPA